MWETRQRRRCFDNISGSGNITTTGNSWSVYLGGNNSGFSGT